MMRLTRFLEVFAYCSAAHAYNLQVTFLGVFSILMGDNEQLKREAVAALESGGVPGVGLLRQNQWLDLFRDVFIGLQIGGGLFIAAVRYDDMWHPQNTPRPPIATCEAQP